MHGLLLPFAVVYAYSLRAIVWAGTNYHVDGGRVVQVRSLLLACVAFLC